MNNYKEPSKMQNFKNPIAFSMQTFCLDAALLWKGKMKHWEETPKKYQRILYANLHLDHALLWKSITIWEASTSPVSFHKKHCNIFLEIL